MPSFKFFKKIIDAKSALNAVSDELRPDELANIEELTYYIVFNGAVSAGALQPETSHWSAVDKNPDGTGPYTGTWSPEGSPVSFAANSVKHVMISGITHWRRVRISTAIVDGTVDVYAMGR